MAAVGNVGGVFGCSDTDIDGCILAKNILLYRVCYETRKGKARWKIAFRFLEIWRTVNKELKKSDPA